MKNAHRFDIDGLRGLAIMLVVVFHVFVGRVSAGVDVFLMLGGLFFFSSQARNAFSPTGLRLWQSLVRILRRLTPALLTVSVATTAGILATYPGWEWYDQLKSVQASTLYWVNWYLAYRTTGYGQADPTVSPVQHLWSMSAQLQIYLASLLMIVLLAALARNWARLTLRGYLRLVIAALAAVTLVSFVFAARLQGTDQTLNYYHSFSRFWEVGAGGLLGFVLSSPRAAGLGDRVSDRCRRSIGATGLMLILVTPYLVNGVGEFPGPRTLLPITGAALVVLAGHGTPRHVGVNAVLASSPLRFLGRISYSLYLWHWPLMILGLRATGARPHSVAFGCAVIAMSLVLAYLTYRFVETPLRQHGKPARAWPTPRYITAAVTSCGRTVAKGAVAVILVVTVTGFSLLPEGTRAVTELRADALRGTSSTTDYPGAAAVFAGAPVPQVPQVLPDVNAYRTMLVQTQRDGCYLDFPETEMVFTHDHNASDTPCRYGDVGSDKTLYLAGGSHSEQYLPAVDAIGKRHGFAVIPLLRMGCALGLDPVTETTEPYPLCGKWSDEVRKWIVDNPPTEGVFLTSTRPEHRTGTGPDVVPHGYVDVVRQFTDAGIMTFGIRDNPWPNDANGVPGGARECVGSRLRSCDVKELYAAVNPALDAYRGLDMVQLDLQRVFCRDGRCPAVIGNVLVYRDGQHLTNMFAETLTDEIDRQMFTDPVSQTVVDHGHPGPESPVLLG